jgi:hypothetical protein
MAQLAERLREALSAAQLRLLCERLAVQAPQLHRVWKAFLSFSWMFRNCVFPTENYLTLSGQEARAQLRVA